MNGKNINKTGIPLKVLVAPLDWGLGHATRCVPIINHLISNGASVILAAEGPSKHLLKGEFPGLVILDLAGYRVKYHAGKSGFLRTMVTQLPGILSTIKKENKWLDDVVKKEKIDVVISDNRYGLYNSKAYTIFITHQLRVRTGLKIVDGFLQGILYRYLEKFNECWVPDVEQEPGLAHGLSHPQQLPGIPVKYLGLLSRFHRSESIAKGFDWLILVSGPEPQRSEWEATLLKDHHSFKGKVLMVRGLPSGGKAVAAPDGWETIDHLPAKELSKLVETSSNVLCRSGYSTLMDLRVLGKKALIVATPGQREQEYLAMKNNGFNGFVGMKQYGNNLKMQLEKMEEVPAPPCYEDVSGQFIRQWMIHFLNREQEK